MLAVDELEITDLEKMLDEPVACEYMVGEANQCPETAKWLVFDECCSQVMCTKHMKMSKKFYEDALRHDAIMWCNFHQRQFDPNTLRVDPL